MRSRILAAALFAGAVLLAGAAITALLAVMGPLPSRRGGVVIPELRAPVDARFDKRGIPHIRSVLEADAWRALGYIHASDRFLQMELRRRAAAGRLSELFGARSVSIDREARINGYAAEAAADWDALGEAERAALSAYAEGVNAFIAHRSLPLELRALGAQPEPWTPLDSLAFGRLLQDGLSAADVPERSAFDDARRRGLDAALALLDAGEPGATRAAPEMLELRGAPAASAPSQPAPEMATAGSNAWALSGTRTASRKPLLAGDPHLAAERPGVWYAAHVTTADGLDAVGLTLPGIPGIIIGHNGRVAWSLTMHQADDVDLFVEDVDEAAGTYLRDGARVSLSRTVETIRVKGGADLSVTVERTGHGPIVETLRDGSGRALARAFAAAGVRQSLEAFLSADRARTGEELVRAWSRYAGPSVNVCWADVSGAVGIKVAGAIPRRLSSDGRFPVPGWKSTYDWGGMIPAGELPAITEPANGLVVTANDDWSATGRTLPYPGVFASSDRANRARQIASLLSAATVADMRAMQNDVYSPYAARIVSALKRMTFANTRAVTAASILAGWDARAAASGPSRLFFAFMKEIRKAAGGDDLRVTWLMLERLIDGRTHQELWDDPSTKEVETRSSRIETALADALTSVEHDEGRDPSRWSWGRAHRLVYGHMFAQALPAWFARRLVFGPVPLPGEWHTLDVGGFPLRGPRYDVTEIPSARIIVDLSAPDASRLVLPLGQSGQLFDRHGHDQLEAWSKGRDFPLPFTAEAVDAATISTLRFVRGE